MGVFTRLLIRLRKFTLSRNVVKIFTGETGYKYSIPVSFATFSALNVVPIGVGKGGLPAGVITYKLSDRVK